ncbi:hypothetical protein BZG35_17510 [Brevundimonas sp. LM2]|uniref:DUF2178 domain-containing protein n=1 Tax=Brevundimonas sp. LM2 TaxID=1938605 RepID=UPI000983C878|nr:DUF2178 domain-containing protein [Brevundimonas sp. LM2]AQR63245.1 hypothetical protein BZG35_17510 [Brevundimonas sp. LM2]
MSFREKHLWISIVATIGVWSVYFRALVDRILRGGMEDPRFAVTVGLGFAGAVFVVALIEAALTVLATFTTPKVDRETRDEREMLAAFKASHVSMSLLIVLVISLASAAWISGVTRQALFTGPAAMVVLANLLVACVVLSELTRFAFTLYLLKRGQ